MEFVGQESARDRRTEAKRTAPAPTARAADGAQIIAFPGARARGRRRLWTALRRWTHPARSRSGTEPQGLRVYRPADQPPGAQAQASEN